ncbi:hypothetical protein GCM10008941_28050 [Rhizomicrobium palustre]
MTHARRRLGAPKEEKHALQQTEGRTGHERHTRANASGESAFCAKLDRVSYHHRIAVPPAGLFIAKTFNEWPLNAREQAGLSPVPRIYAGSCDVRKSKPCLCREN